MGSVRESLLIIGAGGFARETAAAVQAINAVHGRWELLGFLDDDPALSGHVFEGVSVIGPVDEGVAEQPLARVVICTGNPEDYFSRPRIVNRLGLPPERYATIVHPTATLPASAELGHGTVILAGVVATACCRIGSHVALMPMVAVTHDVQIGDFVTLASGACLGGGARVQTGAYVGAGAIVRERLTVGSWSLLGMGAVLTRPMPPAEVWTGVPARHHGHVAVPPDLSRSDE